MEEILAMEHITKTYPGVKALDDVSISFIQGEVHAVMGENGAGKSTLMKILNGMIQADSGDIRFHGEKVAIRNPRDARALGIAMIHQELNPIKDLTVAENMFVGRYPQKGCFVDWSTMYDECRKLFEHWKVDFDPKQKVRTLSTAETQMLEILKAISYDAKLIIMDEPTSAITEREVQKLFSFIEELKGKGITIIIITHKIDEVFHVADRVSVFHVGGNIVHIPIGVPGGSFTGILGINGRGRSSSTVGVERRHSHAGFILGNGDHLTIKPTTNGTGMGIQRFNDFHHFNIQILVYCVYLHGT